MAAENTKDDLSQKEELCSLIRQIAMSGQRQLDQRLSKGVKIICRQSDAYIGIAYQELFKQLERNHAEIRLSVFQLMSELFERSHAFRIALLADFQKFMDLTVETDYELPLPPPAPAAKELKSSVLKTIYSWHQKYGTIYKQLDLAYSFLKNCRQVSFEDIQLRSAAEMRQEEVRQARRNRVQQQRIERVVTEMNECEDELRALQVQLDNCLKLLVSPPEDFCPTVGDEEDSVQSSGASQQKNSDSASFATAGGFVVDVDASESYTEGGMVTPHSSVNIFLPKEITIREMSDNADLLQTFNELTAVVQRRLSAAQKWLDVLSQCGAEHSQIRKALDMRTLLESLKNRTGKLNVIKKNGAFISSAAISVPVLAEKSESSSDDSDEDDLVEVPGVKEGLEYPIPAHRRAEYGLCDPPAAAPPSRKRVKPAETESEDPTSWLATVKKLKEQVKKAKAKIKSSSEGLSDLEAGMEGGEAGNGRVSGENEASRRNRLQSEAPVLPFSTDLLHWGEEGVALPLKTKVDSEKFWHPANDDDGDVVDKFQVEMMKSRCITFSGKFEPVLTTCRAPLANGKLCPRQDRIKCPLHGKIVARDELGQPIVSGTDGATSSGSNSRSTKSVSDVNVGASTSRAMAEGQSSWNDPSLLADIRAATGVDLSGAKKDGRRFGGKKSNLTSLKKIVDNPRNRLEKKVMNKTALDRVCRALNVLGKKRAQQRFANQFNYVLKR